jgi:hypothetical protein
MDMGSAAWVARMALQWAGAALAARGVGDEALWQAVGGALMTLGGAVWSWNARRKQIAMEPPR